MKQKIFQEIIEMLGYATYPAPIKIKDLIVGSDTSLLSGYDIKSIQSLNLSEVTLNGVDMLEVLYTDMLLAWLIDQTEFHNKSWGIYSEDGETYKKFPFKVVQPATVCKNNSHYTYGSLTALPHVMFYISENFKYMKIAYNLYKALDSKYVEIQRTIISNYSDYPDDTLQCLSIIEEKLTELKLFFTQRIVNIREIRESLGLGSLEEFYAEDLTKFFDNVK